MLYPVNAGRAPFAQQGGRLNTLSLVSFIGSFFISLLGIIAGHIALRQIERTGDTGRGFALAGVILGYVGFVSGALALVFFLVALSFTARATGGSTTIEELGGGFIVVQSVFGLLG